MRTSPKYPRSVKSGLGTFSGVFTPSILTILGIILFRRLGYVVGSAGLTQAILMLFLATAISVLTSLSLSAIATNRKVRGGGDYYLISRSLGAEYGGALGLILYAAQAVSVAFYCIGFGEAFVSLIGGTAQTIQLVAAIAATALFGVAYFGADLATRFQFGIMVILIAALTSFFWGASHAMDGTLLDAAWAKQNHEVEFWVIFAVFFPAVTGFTQGVSMSGDLTNPAKSLPLGTFLAVGISTIVYIVAMIALAGSLPQTELSSDYDALKRIAVAPELIDIGVLAATLSSALASFLGAPRILQALAQDRLFAWLTPFSVGVGPQNNPQRGVLLTGIIVVTTITVGDLNSIAAIVSMFFLVSYGLLNYATYVEAHGGSPSFRPRFKYFHARASLAGTGLCAFVMLMIDPLASAIAVGILGVLYQYLRRTAIPMRWVDSRRAYQFRLVKDGLRELDRLRSNSERTSDWQPHILAFTASNARRERVLRVASWISGGSGLVTAVQLIEDEKMSPTTGEARKTAESVLQNDLESHQLDAFPLVVTASDLRAATTTLLQAWGIGPIRANTVLLNWFDGQSEDEKQNLSLWYGRLLQRVAHNGQHIIVLDAERDEWERLSGTQEDDRRIDVWWFNDNSSRLSLLFAYLMTRTEEWDEATLRVVVPTPKTAQLRTAEEITKQLHELRIEASVYVTSTDATTTYSASRDASIMFVPLHLEGMTPRDPAGQPYSEQLTSLPIVAMVSAHGDVRLRIDDETTQADENPPIVTTAQNHN